MEQENISEIVEKIKNMRIESAQEEIFDNFKKNYDVFGDIHHFCIYLGCDSLPYNPTLLQIFTDKARYIYDICIKFDAQRNSIHFEYVENKLRIEKIKMELLV